MSTNTIAKFIGLRYTDPARRTRLPPILVQYANTLLKTKVLFGSDYPLITPDRWLAT